MRNMSQSSQPRLRILIRAQNLKKIVMITRTLKNHHIPINADSRLVSGGIAIGDIIVVLDMLAEKQRSAGDEESFESRIEKTVKAR